MLPSMDLMATLKDVIKNQLQIPYEDIGTSYLASGQQLCEEIQKVLRAGNFYTFTGYLASIRNLFLQRKSSQKPLQQMRLLFLMKV